MIEKENRPICLFGGEKEAKQWIESFKKDEEIYILNQEALMEDVQNFQKFINESSLKRKIGIIYFFNNLNDSKQSVFLKIFEDLPSFSKIIIHVSNFANFTIHTRCELLYLKEESTSEDLRWLFAFFYKALDEKFLNQKIKNGISIYLETLNLFKNGYLNEDQKNCILSDLR